MLAIPPRDNDDAGEVHSNSGTSAETEGTEMTSGGVSSPQEIELTTVAITVNDQKESEERNRESPWGLLGLCAAEQAGGSLEVVRNSNDAGSDSSNDSNDARHDSNDDVATLRAKLTRLTREKNRTLAGITEANAKLQRERDGLMREKDALLKTLRERSL